MPWYGDAVPGAKHVQQVGTPREAMAPLHASRVCSEYDNSEDFKVITYNDGFLSHVFLLGQH